MIKLEVILRWFNRIIWIAILLGVLRISAILKRFNEKLEAES